MTAGVERFEEDIFVLDADEGNYYVYAPLRRSVALVNASAVRAVGKFVRGGWEALDGGERAAIEELRQQGILKDAAPRPPVAPADYSFCPYEVTLFPTTRCNLRCVYCYADSGTAGEELSWDAAKAAIDFVAGNAASVGREDFVVGFHGGGEPTLCWDLIRRCTEYALEQASEKGLKAHIHTASNGVLAPAQREFIAAHFKGINISLDGPRDVQDRQRPMADGQGSFDSVMETIRHFEALKFPYGIRATVTAQSAPELTESIRFFHSQCPSLDQVHVEPVWYCGRCRTSGERPPEREEFVRHFLAARDEGKKAGLKLFYSGARLDVLTNRFCAAAGEGFAVTPQGIVSSCFEVTSRDDPRAQTFHYGFYDRISAKYEFDEERLRRLRNLSVENIPYCRDCFCKWHCAGDCLAKALGSGVPEAHMGSLRCALNREITLAEIRSAVQSAQRRAGSCWR